MPHDILDRNSRKRFLNLELKRNERLTKIVFMSDKGGTNIGDKICFRGSDEIKTAQV